ncbi:phage tail sheath C-terminal domain-containing protein [Brevibacillus agri]|uniref:phage tail sheath C-terminal domain-containing protein n=1 Tax=Brevibacillus agri TaxID=51101 RepID=UPI0025B6BCC3|nr:phage tail sheath C-terminal domain-containing protein [Brevibacillus agri]MDN4093574.1 phage tail sheath C-terminal domain-containing protein [Brevibacillus agri]
MAIGMPTIDVIFKKLAASLIARSQRGIVSLIVKDDTQGTSPVVTEYKSQLAVETNKFTPSNVQYIKDVLNRAMKVIVVSVPTTSTSVVADAIGAIGSRKYNWIGLAEGTPAEQADLVAYVKEQEAAKKSIKAVVYKATAPDSQHVVNFTNNSVTYTNGTTVTGEKFVPRLLGVLAGLPLTRSSTYYSFPELASVEEPEDLDAAINSGEFVLFNDDDVVRVARGVNSLTSTSPTVSEDFKKILIVETLDMMRDDISTTFKNDYLGKYKNTYDNQVLFLSAITNGYFYSLAQDGILDSNYDNRADVDVEAQRAAWLAIGKTEAEDWDEQKVKNMPFRSSLFLSGRIFVPDAMEDLQFNIELQ